MNQVLWSDSFCQQSYLPCIKSFGLTVSVSRVTFHVSSPLVWQFLSAVTFHESSPLVWQFLSAELPSINQVLWSDSFCQQSYLPWIKSFGLTVSVSWATFHESSPFVWQFLSAELPSMNQQVLWSDSVCQLSYLPWINKSFGLIVSVSWVTFHESSPLVWQFLSAELPSMYQVLLSDSFCSYHVSSPLVWQFLQQLPSMNQVLLSDSFCQLSYLPWIKSFGLTVSVSRVTFHESSPLVWQCLSAEYLLVWQCLSAELPSMYQVLWSDSVCQLSYLPWIKSFGLTVSVSWATFHESSPLVWQCLSAELPSMNQVLWSDSELCQLSYLPCHQVKSFGLTVSVSWATFHESSPLVWQCLSAETFHESSPLVWQCLSAELPSMNQVLWSDSVCQLSYLPWIKSFGLSVSELPSMSAELSYLPWIKSFGLTVSVSWATFHDQVLWSLSAELPSMNQVLWSDSVCQLSYLPWINKSFGLIVSVSWATFHESSPLVW